MPSKVSNTTTNMLKNSFKDIIQLQSVPCDVVNVRRAILDKDSAGHHCPFHKGPMLWGVGGLVEL